MKYSSSTKYHSKYDDNENHFEHRSGGKSRGEINSDTAGRNSPSLSRRVQQSPRDRTPSIQRGGGNNIRFSSGFQDRFDFSLRIGSLDVDMHDGDLKTCLFDRFKHYGFIHIKVLGRGYERHAFINFTRKEDAQKALSEMSEFVLDNVTLKTEWSKSTIYRYPEVVNSPFLTRSRIKGGLSTTRPSSSTRSRHHDDDHYDNYGAGGATGVSGRRDCLPSLSSSREKSFTGREVSSRRSREVTRDIPREVSRELAPPRDVPPPSPRDIPRRVSRNVGRRDSREPRDISYKISDNRSLSPPSPPRGGHHSSSSGGMSSSSRHEPRTVIPITDPMATRTLFVGNLEQDITERELRDLFGPYGRIESVDIKTARLSGATYAFVKFLTINDAINAKNDMHGRKYGDYHLKIGFGRGSPTGKVWIGNLTCLADLKEVRLELDRFGLIRKMDYQEGDNHAFIQLDSLDAAHAAIASLAGYRIRNTGRVLKIDLCKPMHLREDPDLHIRHGLDTSHSLDDACRSSSSMFKRKVREHDYQHSASGEDNSLRRMKDGLDNIPSLKRERIVTSSNKGHGTRDESRREHRKRPHSPAALPSNKDGYSGGSRSRSGVNGVGDYHTTKRPKISSGESGRRTDKERNRDVDRERDRQRDRNRSNRDQERSSKRANGNKEKREHHNGKEGDNNKAGDKNDVNDKNKDEKRNISGEKSEKKEDQLQHPVLESTLSDIATSKDTALKLDDVPEQLTINTGSGGPVHLEPAAPETLNDLAILYPVAWRGNLVLKNTGFPTRMHLVGGDPTVAETLLRTREGKDYLLSLRITQRLRLEQPRLEEVNKRMASAGPSGYCVLLALPGPMLSTPQSPDIDSTMQLRPLKSLVSYLKQKEAAGIVALSGPEGSETASASVDKDVVGVLHAFPPCDFSQSQLLKIAPKLGQETTKEDHIVVLLVKGNV